MHSLGTNKKLIVINLPLRIIAAYGACYPATEKVIKNIIFILISLQKKKIWFVVFCYLSVLRLLCDDYAIILLFGSVIFFL